MRQGLAKGLMYSGAFSMLGAAFAELGSAKTWAEVMTPEHVFAFLGAVVAAVGALYHDAPRRRYKDGWP